MKVGVLTGGGDCPGLNAVIRAVARRSFTRGHEVVGIREGWRGLVEGRLELLGNREINGLLPRGGTIIGTSRTNPYKVDGGVEAVLETFSREGLDALVAIGGEDTLGVATRLHAEHDFPVVGVPKTIDNDIAGTDVTIGFDTAVHICTEAIDRLHTTAESHNRVMVVEVMGRDTGWIAAAAGVAGGADVILVPEVPRTIEDVCDHLRRRHEQGRDFSIVVVAEGYRLTRASGVQDAAVVRELDEYGYERLGGIAHTVAEEIESLTGFDTRVTVLGHVQRGGTPTARDRVLATRFGTTAADLAREGTFGTMVAARGTQMVAVPLAEACEGIRGVDPELYEVARTFFG